MSANIAIQSDVTEISIEHDAYSNLTISIEQHTHNDQIKVTINDLTINLDDGMMCAEKTGGFNLVNYRHSSGVYHEQETEDLHRRI
ncbi:hypothetical protein [Acinetobacter beijerinckii]|uniref:hypothetical protein n=1 Tax=Acinetobacter beijerinckii TaxID=262668 RepID=UPI0024075A18|nr:hypothetical protein [Acinetobacter beijerinckii]